MARKTTGKMMWFNKSDLESEADDDMKQSILRRRQAEGAKNNVGGELGVVGL